MKTTLNKIKNTGACSERYKVLLASLNKTEADDEPLLIRHILQSNGLDDVLWALQTVEGKDRELRLFACDCAEMVLPIFERHYPDDKRPRNSIEVARRFAEGKATDEERAAAGAAAWAAARAAAWDAAWDAAGAAAWAAAGDAAGDAARAAAWDAARAAAGAQIETLLLLKYL